MQVKKKKILWLCRDKLLQQVEVPFLRDVGFEVFVPSEFSDCGDSSLYRGSLSDTDRELLDNFDFWKCYFSLEIIEIINRNFKIVLGELNQYLSDSLVSFFPGLIFIREMGYGNDFGNPPKIEEMYPPTANFWASFYENRSRINLISSVKSLPQYLGDVFVNRSMWIPPVFPFRDKEPKTAELKRNVVLFSCPEIKSFPENKKRYHFVSNICSGLPCVALGKQSIECQTDYCVVDNNMEEDAAIYRESAVFFEPSQNPSTIERSAIKALMNETPLIFMRKGFFAGLESAKSLPGCCSSYKEAGKKLKRIINGDSAFRQYVLDSQQVLKRNFHIDFNKYYYYNILFPCIEEKCAISYAPKRIGVIMQQAYGGGTVNAFRNIIQMLVRLKANITVGVTSDYLDTAKPVHNLDILDEIRKITPSSVPVRAFKFMNFPPELQTYYNSLFQSGRRVHPDLIFNDDINFFQECDEFIFISDRTEATVRLTGKPYSIIVYDYLQRYVDKNFIPEPYESKFLNFVRGAKRIFVTTRATKADIVSYVGYPKDKISVLPFELSFEELEKYLSEPAEMHNDFYSFSSSKFSSGSKTINSVQYNYILWACNSSEHKNHLRIIQAFKKYCQENIDYNGVLVVSGVLTNCLDPANDDFMEYPHVRDLKKYLKKNPDVGKRIFFAGEMPRHAFLSTMKNADAVLLSSIYDNGAYAAMESACLRVPCISAKYPGIEELAQYLGIKPTWYDAYDIDSIAEALKCTIDNRDKLSKNLPDISSMKKFDISNMDEKFKFAMHGVID